MSVTIKAFLRKSLPVLAGGAIALSAATAANAASGYKMINPEDFKREYSGTPYTLYDYPYMGPYDAASGLMEGGNPHLGGILNGSCVYASLHFPKGALLEALKLHVGGSGPFMLGDAPAEPISEYNLDVEIWKVNLNRTNLNTLLSETITNAVLLPPDAPAEGPKPVPYEFPLNETSNPKQFLYTLQICGYGEVFSGRVYYSVED